jgi:hypothetical protein
MPFQVSDIFQPGTENFFSKFDSGYTFLSCKLEPNRLIIQNAVGETGCVLVNNQITNERVFFPRTTRFFNAEALKIKSNITEFKRIVQEINRTPEFLS